MVPSSPSRGRDRSRMRRRQDEKGSGGEGKSKKRRRSASSSPKAAATFPLTEHGVQMIVKGLALAKPEDLRKEKILIEKENQGSEHNDNDSNADKEGEGTSSKEHPFDEMDVPTLKEVILKLRMDRKTDSTNILLGTASDGKEAIRVLLPDSSGKLSRRLDKEKQRNKKYDWIISVKGYTTTEAVRNDKFSFFPYVCLTAVSVLSTIKKKGTVGDPFPYKLHGPKKAKAGLTGSFLEHYAPLLTVEELIGVSRISPDQILRTATKSDEASAKADIPRVLFPETSPSNFKTVQDFVSFSTAMNTIHQSTASASASSEPQSPVQASIESNMFSPSKLPTHQAADLYLKALEEFKTSQMDRQNASLATNAGRESADKAARIVQQYNAVLAVALEESRPLTTEMLCSWHRQLMDGVGNDGGNIRSRTVRCGKTVFCLPTQVRSELDLFCNGLQALKKRLDLSNPIHMVLYASVAMYGVIDIHPFLDGNGRVSRIVANYALKQLPFPINLFATAAQRADYVMALEQTRFALSFRARGDISTDEILFSFKIGGVFHPLMTLLMDCIAKAALECNRVWEEKSGLFAEAAEARAARKHRERSAQGTCIICFDAQPNICTLCCGKPIHLNCIAEWLSSNTTCPNCRSQMPAISGRVVRAARRNIDDETETDNASGALGHIEDIRETRDLLARIYDQVSQRGSRRDANSSEENSFSDPSEIGDTTTTTSDEDSDSFDDSEGDSDEEDDGEAHFLEVFRASVPVEAARDDATARRSQSEDIHVHDTTSTTTDGDSSDPAPAANSQDSAGASETSTTAEMDEEAAEGEDTTSTSPDGSSRRSLPFCSGDVCNNRAAVDCTNNLCGRCCVLGGEFHCSRHNS